VPKCLIKFHGRVNAGQNYGQDAHARLKIAQRNYRCDAIYITDADQFLDVAIHLRGRFTMLGLRTVGFLRTALTTLAMSIFPRP